MSTHIYYFSGTGNSLHVARELQRRIPESDLIPIIHLLNRETIRTTADTVGLVFPNFCLTVPIPVHDLLEKVDMTSARYRFAVCTRGGTPSEAFNHINAVLRKQGRSLDAQLNVTMPWNHPLGEEDLPATATPERIEQLESDMHDKLDRFSEHVRAHRRLVEDDIDAPHQLPRWTRAMSSLIPKSLNYGLHRHMYQNVIQFYADSTCQGCGVCETVCLSNRIEMVDERPAWKDEPKCYGCFACTNFCPQQAIQIQSRFPVKSSTALTARYHHPAVTYREIAEQR